MVGDSECALVGHCISHLLQHPPCPYVRSPTSTTVVRCYWFIDSTAAATGYDWKHLAACGEATPYCGGGATYVWLTGMNSGWLARTLFCGGLATTQLELADETPSCCTGTGLTTVGPAAILTCAQKLAGANLIYRTELTKSKLERSLSLGYRVALFAWSYVRAAVSIQNRLVTDKRTDGRTDRHTTTANVALAYSVAW